MTCRTPRAVVEATAEPHVVVFVIDTHKDVQGVPPEPTSFPAANVCAC
ncbi:hypothetical protein [Streptomyces scabiei]|nr:hypothetical protein [Streptomyces scabiei]MDX2540181.1 hypothetical protein [Streptomyces scabiei]